MNTNLPRTIRLNTVLLPVSLHREQPVTLLDWESAPLIDDGKADSASSDTRPSRRNLRERVRTSDGAFLQSVLYQAEQAKTDLQRLAHFLDAQLRDESPSLSKLMAAIDGARQAAQALLPPGVVVTTPSTAVATDAAGTVNMTGTSSPALTAGNAPNVAPNDLPAHKPSHIASPVATDKTQNINHQDPAIERAQAYIALAEIAARLKILEPHSPTPFMIERALALGNMPLPEMITAINASAGSMDRFFELLGISPPKT
jgi:type VI secretion system protein ImpA